MKKLILLFIFTLIKSATFAQLVADFTTVDGKEGGCSPLAISFKNTTKGASISATYKWDLGNQNFSTLQHPGTVYTAERSYQVTLTVTDGTSTSTKTKTIIVYKKPVVDFVVTNGKGCAPLVTTFNSLATPGDGRITRYFWDFGDGVVAQDTNLATIQHTYTFAKKAKIDLVVTNSFGCQNTIRKDTLVEIKNKVSVNFSANNTALCNTTQQVQFNNNSNGPGNVTYSWNFGDGQTSAEKNPIHQYAQNGKYTVRLTVNSSFGKGCDNQLEQKDFIKIADFGSSISVPTLICTGSSVTFSAINSANPTATNWSFSDNNFATASSNNTVSKTFTSVGNYIVRLINTYGFCKDTVLRNVMISKGIALNGFLVNAANACNIPSTVYFEDTTKAAVKWSWNFNTNVTGATANTKAPAYAYRNEGNFPVELTIENAEGCKAKTTKQVVIKKANVTIQVLRSSSSNGLNGCPGLSVTFATISSTNIKQYEWSFGDGFTSNSIQPTHVYQKVGVFSVKLKYTTIDGCIDSATGFENIKIYQKPKANFTVSNNIICGNNPVVFTNTSTPTSNKWFWDFGDKNTSPLSTNNHVVSHKYLDSGYFSVRLIAVNEACADTTDKIRFLQVTPPFTKIANISNTCKNNRGEVIFTFTTKGATKFEWDFGDGNSKTLEGGPKPVIHTYAQSGRYNVKLKAFSVACTVEDGGVAQVLLKNHPSLTASKSQICLNDSIQIKISNLITNPSNTGYEVFKVENKNGNTSSAKQRPVTTKWTNEYVAHLSSIPRGTDSVRFILQSNQFNCYDTTNFISITSSGPIANFNIQTKTPCFKEAVTFNDLSTADSGAPIKKWEWFFGDAKTSVQTQSISIQHQYTNPGLYQPVLKVTDVNGCFAVNATAHNNFEVKGPKAAFTYAPSIIAPNLPVTFTNASNIFGNTSVQYNWQFSVGKFASNSNTTVTRNYANSVSKDTVTLVVRDQSSKCSDTAIQVITLKRMDLNFTFSTEYLSTNDCPPLLAKFVGKSSNAQFITWNFGDNSSASNINSPSHTYHQPGIYTITMYGYGENNLIDSVSKQIEIKGPYASLFANSYNNCTPAKLTLGAKAKNATSFIWDFGDGTLSAMSADTFATHTYTLSGVYRPTLIMKDVAGCSSIFEMKQLILLDSIDTKDSIVLSSNQLCNEGVIAFDGNVKSLGNKAFGQPNKYEWNVGNGLIIDSSQKDLPKIYFHQLGTQNVQLQVTSPGGCKANFTNKILVKPSAKPQIHGLKNICIGEKMQISATSNRTENIQWHWKFENGNTSQLQQPIPQIFTNTKSTNTIELITNLDGCLDTVVKEITVHERPLIQLTPNKARLCLGDSIQLTAHNGSQYEWLQAKVVTANPTFFVRPNITSHYSVKAINKFGCEAIDSTLVEVVQPLKLSINNTIEACIGSTVQLQVNGADTYQWMNVNNELSNAQIANPTTVAQKNTKYKVVGFDKEGCFTDTAEIGLIVHALPTVQAGNDIVVGTGSSTTLKPTYSSDVQRVQWFPTQYLNAANSTTPIVTPKSDMTYVVTATSKYGCEAKDSIRIDLQCIQDNLFLPTGFTPNKNGLNDVFYPLGRGIKVVKHFAIYNRAGQLIFEKSNFQINDKLAGWNGKFQGHDQPMGTYIYSIEVECDTNEIFSKKGTITLIR